MKEILTGRRWLPSPASGWPYAWGSRRPGGATKPALRCEGRWGRCGWPQGRPQAPTRLPWVCWQRTDGEYVRPQQRAAHNRGSSSARPAQASPVWERTASGRAPLRAGCSTVLAGVVFDLPLVLLARDPCHTDLPLDLPPDVVFARFLGHRTTNLADGVVRDIPLDLPLVAVANGSSRWTSCSTSRRGHHNRESRRISRQPGRLPRGAGLAGRPRCGTAAMGLLHQDLSHR